ncbi:hypothetical protein E1171_02195 [Cytophagales bacterium RKSG123]|nr:OmpA family protein [Xanthovirga aplysinae]MTI29610.1 hypothetical protein [Xanthovirga aplysinae]
MKSILPITFFFFFFVVNGFAQEVALHTKSKKAIAFYKEAGSFIHRRQYPEAVEVLQKALKKDAKFSEAHFRIASCYEKLRNPKLALKHYQELAVLDHIEKRFTKTLLYIARLEFKGGNYSAAEDFSRKYLESTGRGEKDDQEARDLLHSAVWAQEKMTHPLDFNPHPLPTTVNAFSMQYFPVLTADQASIIFTARKGKGNSDEENIYISRINDKGEWQSPKSISSKINTWENEGTSSISADGRTLIFTKCSDREGFGSCDLYISYKVGEEWTKPKNLGSAINSTAWESQPSLSADGRTLYFVSNRKGGFGKRDIWVSKMGDDGQWQQARNLGSDINSLYDDIGPFIHANGQTLYFSSDRFPGFGGFDLYASEKEGERWANPQNLGYPINTHDDQVSFFVSLDGKTAYYSVDQRMEVDGVGSQLYEVALPEEVSVKRRSDFVSGKVFDAKTKRPLGATVELYDLNKDSKIAQVQADEVSGEYLMVLSEGSSYALYVNKKGYLFQSLSFDYENQNDEWSSVKLDVYLKPLTVGEAVPLNNIFFAIDSYLLDDKSKTELKKVVNFMELNPKLRVEIGGHTDDVGSSSYNQKLSEQRAKAVYEFLLKAGIASGQLEYKGFGKEKPFVKNSSEVNRQKNRRIEFKVL